MRGCFRSCYAALFKKSGNSLDDAEIEEGMRPSERARRNSVAEDRWHAVSRWVKYLEILESEGHRWSKPHVTTLCPYYIHVLRKNLRICNDDLYEYHRSTNPVGHEDEIYRVHES